MRKLYEPLLPLSQLLEQLRERDTRMHDKRVTAGDMSIDSDTGHLLVRNGRTSEFPFQSQAFDLLCQKLRVEVRAADEKGGTAKRAYLTPQLQAVLGGDDKIHHLPASLLFRRKNGKPWDSQSLGRRLRKALDACKDEQIPAAKRKLMTFHSLRHTARSILRDLGFDAFAISAMVGHKTVEMAAHYTHTRPEELERMAMELGRAGSSPPSRASQKVGDPRGY